MKTNGFDRLQVAFEKASRMNGHELSDFVEALGRRDPEIAEEVQSLLAHNGAESDPLEFICEARQRAIASMVTTDRTVLPKIAGYQVAHRIGSGGQADVYLAHQESTGQPVAVKVFRGFGLTESQRHRIDTETEALVRLQLPNIVPILDRALTECGRESLITRFVEGHPIDQAASRLLEKEPTQAIHLFVKVAKTLARVHRHGIVHRDLKPSNILVDRDNEPYILDFGLARFFADPSGRLLSASVENGFQGSIYWASPEQVDASFGPVDLRTDIYSLGVVLYQALAGRFPYPMDNGILAVAQQIVRTRPQPLRELSSPADPSISSALSSVVLRALEKRPDRRFQTAGEFADALKDVTVNRPAETIRQHPRPQRLVWTLAGVAGTTVAVTLVVSALANRTQNESNSSPQPQAVSASTITPPAPDEPPGPGSDRPSDDSPAPASDLDETLLPFGQVPAGWSQVGPLRNQHHEMERSDVRIAGDFTLRLTLSADRRAASSFALTLIGDGSSNDLKIAGTKTNTWSDNESWILRTPAGETRAGLPIGSHTFTLKRQGNLYTLSADAVYRPDRNSNALATFAAGDRTEFKAVRIMTNGPVLQLEGLRLHVHETEN